MVESRIHVGDLKPGDIALLKDVAEQAADQAVSKTFIRMGLDPDDPIEAQADMAWVRQTRKRGEGRWGKVTDYLITAGIVGATSAFWIGFQHIVSGGKLHP